MRHGQILGGRKEGQAETSGPTRWEEALEDQTARGDMASHFGHMTIVRDGTPCDCGNRGCWEAYGSGTAFTPRTRKRAAADPGSMLAASAQSLDGAAVFAAAAAGDALADELVAEEADILGVDIAAAMLRACCTELPPRDRTAWERSVTGGTVWEGRWKRQRPGWLGHGVDLLGYFVVAGARNHRELTSLTAAI